MKREFFLSESTIPSVYQEEFGNEVVMLNVMRTGIISRFTLGIYASLIVLVDIQNVMRLTEEQRTRSLMLHIVVISIILCYMLTIGIVKKKYPKPPYTLYRVLSTVFGGTMLFFGDVMVYLIAGASSINVIAVYITYILIWGMTMMFRPPFMAATIMVNLAFVFWLLSINGVPIEIERVMVSFFASIAVVLFSRMMYTGYQRNFLSRKHLEQERNRIAVLNGEIATAYEEAETLNKYLTETLRELEAEKRKSEALLLNVLPVPIADRLKAGETLIADIHEEATILFADIVGFTKLSAQNSAVQIVQILNEVFSEFDRLSEQYGLEKIKTIGDAYMVVGGIPTHRHDHAEAVATMALDVLDVVQEFSRQSELQVQVRIGIHTGAVVAGVIGTKKFVYDLWGDTVNTASRMESHGEEGKIHCTDEVRQKLEANFDFEARQAMEIKGKGLMQTWFLRGRKNFLK